MKKYIFSQKFKRLFKSCDVLSFWISENDKNIYTIAFPYWRKDEEWWDYEEEHNIVIKWSLAKELWYIEWVDVPIFQIGKYIFCSSYWIGKVVAIRELDYQNEYTIEWWQKIIHGQTTNEDLRYATDEEIKRFIFSK